LYVDLKPPLDLGQRRVVGVEEGSPSRNAVNCRFHYRELQPPELSAGEMPLGEH
jgi:hypothetical protein